MDIIQGTSEFHIDGPTAIAIGKFDGIHKGHRKLIADLIEEKNNGKKTVIFTFDPSPSTFFAGHVVPGLSTKEEKRTWFEENGMDVLVEFPMNCETASTPPDLFIKRYLKQQMEAAFVAAGNDVSFGAGGKGNWELLTELGKELGFDTHLIEKVEMNGREISSTYIREEVSAGHMENVARLLGAPYTLHGTVQHGKALGRTIGIPTVNLVPPAEKLLPPNGVYYSIVQVGDRTYRGMTNVGSKPTVTDEGKIVAETYLYDFSGDLYGYELSVSLLSYKRPEMHFAGIDELKKQMSADVEAGRVYHHGISSQTEIWKQ